MAKSCRRSSSRAVMALSSSSAQILLALTVLLAPSSWDGLPCCPGRLRCWTSSSSSSSLALRTTTTAVPGSTSGKSVAGFALAGTVPDFVISQEEKEEPPKRHYCPAETPVSRAKANNPHPGRGPTCRIADVIIENSSGMKIGIYWVDTEGQEVWQFSVNAGHAAIITSCREHYWRARPFSPDGRRRLLFEGLVPQLSMPTRLLPSSEDTSEDLHMWKVLACEGFPLPMAFDLASSLGGAGGLQLSRVKLGGGMTDLQKRLYRQSTDITKAVSLTMEQAYTGKGVHVEFERRSPCPVCNGFGATSFVTCDRCQGSGKRVYDTSFSGRGDGGDSDGGCGCGGVGGGCDGSGSGSVGAGNGGGGVRYRIYSGETDITDRIGTTDDDANLDNGAERRPATRKAWGGGRGIGGGGGEAERGETLKYTADCAKCEGTGKVPWSREDSHGVCGFCVGERLVGEKLNFWVSVPPGVKGGHRETYPGEGHVDLADLLAATVTTTTWNMPDSKSDDTQGDHKPGSPPRRREVKRGDVVIAVNVLPHELFSIVDGELHMPVSLNLEEALGGFSREITRLDGSVVTIRRSSPTVPGELIRFPNLGLPLSSLDEHELHPEAEETAGECNATGVATPETKKPTKGNRQESPSSSCSSSSSSTAATDRKGKEDGTRGTMFGDLVVQASVTLPAAAGVGIRDDRYEFIGAFLGTDFEREEQPDSVD